MKEMIIGGIIAMGIVYIISTYLVFIFDDGDKFRVLDVILNVGFVTVAILICMTILMYLV